MGEAGDQPGVTAATAQEAVARHCRVSDLIRRGDRIGVAYSGGADSLATLILLQCLYPAHLVVACHVDHGMDPGSSGRAEAAAGNAALLEIPTVTVTGKVQGTGDGLEAAARTARFDALARVAADLRLDAIALGHTADDRAETLLLALLRGAGLDGLAALPPAAGFPRPGTWRRLSDAPTPRLLRPVLCLTRADTLAVCRHAGLEHVEDPSNSDMRFLRNRVRHEMMPLIEELRPGATERIAATAELLDGDRAALDRAAAAWESCVVDTAPGFVALDAAALDTAAEDPVDRALVSRVLRRALASLRDGTAPSRAACDAVLHGRGGTLPGTDLGLRTDGGLRVVSAPVPGPSEPVPLNIPGVTRLAELAITCRRAPDPGQRCLVRMIVDGDRRPGSGTSLKGELERVGVPRRIRERACVVLAEDAGGTRIVLAALVPGRTVPSGALDADCEWWWDSGARRT